MASSLAECPLAVTEESIRFMVGMLAHSDSRPRTLTFRTYHAPTQRTLTISLTLSGTLSLPSMAQFYTQEIIQVLRPFLQDTLPSTQGTFALPSVTSTPTTPFTHSMSWKVEHELRQQIYPTSTGLTNAS